MELKSLADYQRQSSESLGDYAQRLIQFVRESVAANSLSTETPFNEYLTNHYNNLSRRSQAAILCCYGIAMTLEAIDPELNEICVQYSGSGDSGQIEDIYYGPSSEKFADELDALNKAVDEMAWDIAYGTNPGFEINEGGQGTVTIRRFNAEIDDEDNGTGWKVVMHHEENIMEIKEYEYAF